eukprot:5396292-Lingulodinium_polyedra.AAC.1
MSAATSTMLWPEMHLMKELANDSTLEQHLDRQWLGNLFLPGMLVKHADSSALHMSLGSVQHLGPLLWPVHKHEFQGCTLFELKMPMEVLNTTNREVPWVWQ